MFLCLFATLMQARVSRAQDAYVSYQSFYESLSPYGTWIDDPQYGYVFVPSVDNDFRPYFTDGHWLMTEYGNTWVSDYAWGWACFHYGRWIYNAYYGWVWVPGSEWGPGWVSWRWGGGYCGWAPLYPDYVYGAVFICPDDWWIFMHPKHLYQSNYVASWRSDFLRGAPHTRKLIAETQPLNNAAGNDNTNYSYGPRVSQVQDVTHNPVYVYQVKQAAVRGPESVNYHELTIYKPEHVQPLDRDGERAVPSSVMAAPQRLGQPEKVQRSGASAPVFRSNYAPANTAMPSYSGEGRSNGGANGGVRGGSPSAAPGRQNAQPRPSAPAPRSSVPRSAPAPSRAPSGGGHRR